MERNAYAPVSCRSPKILQLLFLLFFVSVSGIVSGQILVGPENPRTLSLEVNKFQKWLQNAPMENSEAAKGKSIIIDVPLPEGGTIAVKAVESPIVDQAAYKRLSDVKTYSVQGVEDPSITGRIMVSPRGFDGVLLTNVGKVHIEPQDIGSVTHKVYYATPGGFPHEGNDTYRTDDEGNVISTPSDWHRHENENEGHSHELDMQRMMTFNIGTQRREFRMHVIVDAEYSIAVCGASPTRACVETAIMAALNGMNALYIRDMAIKLNLTTNTTIYLTQAANPPTFAPGGGASNPSWIGESLGHHTFMETNTTSDGSGGTNAMVPQSSYDVGHLFSGRVGMGFGGGGAAFLNSVCNTFNVTTGGMTGPIKAGGGSGVPNPQGSGWVDLLAHEFTHQFNADHSWNGSSGNCTEAQFGTDSPYEPGGGSTIVSYANICAPQNIPNQGNTSYYHAASIRSANDHIANTGCVTNVASGNSIPVVSTSVSGCTPNYNIPTQTPFEITGSATDANDPAGNLTYCWEQWDRGTRSSPIEAPLTNATTLPPATAAPNTAPAGYAGEPLFRSYFPNSSGTRSFPSLDIIKSGNYNADQTAAALGLGNWQGELLSEVARTINLRLTVRDNNTTAGGVEAQDVAINVINTGAPFKVTAPDGGETLTAGNSTTITWNVSGTTAAPISCANVTIKLSTDGGSTYPHTIATTPNTGTWTGALPATLPNSTTARVRVECGTDCFKFFDISNADLTVSSNCTAAASNICPTAAMTVAAGAAANLSMTNAYGTGGASLPMSVTGSDPMGTLVGFTNAGPTVCGTFAAMSNYSTVDFMVDATGTYSINLNTANPVVSFFTSAGYNPAAPCTGATFIGSNFNSSTGSASSTIGGLTLTECTVYKMVVFATPVFNGTAAFSGPGTVYPTGTTPANSGYTYVAVNTANSQVAAESATSDFSSLTAGTYKVYGASYKNGGAATPANSTPSSWVGQTTAAVAAAECAVFSTNCKSLTITGATCTPPVVTAPTVTQPTCATPTGTIVVNATGSGTLEYSVDNGASWQASNVFSGLAAGNYNIVVRLQSDPSCMTSYASNPVVLNAATGCCTPPTVTAPTVTCSGGTGTIVVNATGSGTLEYSVDNGASWQASNVFSGLADGNYNVVVRLQSDPTCMTTYASNPVAVACAAACSITATAVATDETCPSANDGTITVTASATGCTGTLEYSLDGGTYQASNVFTAVAPGAHTVTVRCSNDLTCTGTAMATVNAGMNTAPTITCPPGQTLVCTDALPVAVTTEADFIAQGGTISSNCPPYTVSSVDMDNGGDNCPGNGRVVTRTYTVTEGTESSTCMQTLTYLASTQEPVITSILPSATIECGTDASPAISDITYDTDCNNGFGGMVTITGPTIIGTTDCPGTINRYTYTATDDCGRASLPVTRDFIISNNGPTITCNDITVTLDASGAYPTSLLPADEAAAVASQSASCSLGSTITSFIAGGLDCDDVGPNTNTVTLVVTDDCGRTNTCAVSVSVIASDACPDPGFNNAGGPTIADPCTCRGNGEFDEEVFIQSVNPGQMWEVSAVAGLTDGAGGFVTPGTMFVDNGDDTYSLVGVHQEIVGYTLSATSPFYPGRTLMVGNTCFYPDPVIVTDLSEVCLFTPVITLEGNAGAGVAGTGTFSVNGGAPTTTLDPSLLGIGTHTVEFTFDAGAALGYKILNGAVVGPPDGAATLADAQADPGCEATVSTIFNIVETPTEVACNDDIQVSVDGNCEVLITPDMILEGTYNCFDDYEVTLARGTIPVSNPVTGTEIGRSPITATVTHLISGNSCWGKVRVEDKLAPNFDCSVTLTDKMGNVIQQGDVIDITCDIDPADIPAPTAIDNCDPAPFVSLTNEQIITSNCANITILRTYDSRDIYGNTGNATCLITINITQPEITFPDDITWSCQQYNAFPNIANATELHPLIIDNAADIDAALLCCISGAGGDDVPGVDPYDGAFYWMDGEDLDVSLDPRYEDNLDNPITDSNPACGTASAETDSDSCRAMFSYMIGCTNDQTRPFFPIGYLNGCDLNAGGHVPNIMATPAYWPPFIPNPYPAEHPIRGLEDADVLEYSGSGVPNVALSSNCTFAVTHTDQKVEACEGLGTDGSTFKIIRTWRVLNWCTGQVSTDVQVIKVLDRKAPEITFDDNYDDELVSNVPSTNSGHPECRSNGLIDVPTVTDDCSGVVDIRVFTPAGEGVAVKNGDIIVGFSVPAPYLQGGTHTITYRVSDACGNTTEVDRQITVIDGIPPVMVCREFTQIALSSETEGLTSITAEHFDEGTYDYCGPVYFKVRRMEPFGCDRANVDTPNEIRNPNSTSDDREWFDDEAIFCCSDIGDSVTVVLRAYDIDPGAGSISPTTHGDRYNECMVRVLVEDKTRPTCIAPADVWTNCTDVPDNLDLEDTAALQGVFGNATYRDNCDATVEELAPSLDVDLCGVGQVTRRWRVEDAYGNRNLGTCSQTIMIMIQTEYTLTLPGDFQEECDDAAPQELEYEEIACDLLAVSMEDHKFNTADTAACMKIFRTWKVINWCEYDGFSDPLVLPRLDINNDGHVGDGNGGSTTPVNHSATNEWASDGDRIIFVPNPLLNGPSTGYYQYEQHIKIYDNTAPELSYSGDTQFCGGDRDEDPCTGEVDILPEIDELCTGVDVRWELSTFSDHFANADYQDNDNLTGRYALGTHTVRFYVSDECGNESVIDITFEIIDCKAPTPVCYNGLSIDVMPLTGMVEVWASDYDASSFDYCHPFELRINRVVDTNGDNIINSDDYVTTVPQYDSVQFTCADVGTFVTVQMWVGEISSDDVNDWDYCVSYMEVQDNNGTCSGNKVALGGKIANEDGESVEHVMVELNDQNGSMMTDATGEFGFTVAQGGDYTITPMRTDDVDNGVSTFDLVKISRHILNVEPLNSAYKIIAADANRSGKVTTIDLVAIRKVILKVTDVFPNNTSWRFVDKAYTFQDATQPLKENFKEVISLNNLTQNELSASFVAVKVGDVNGDAVANSTLGVDNRTFNGTLNFKSEDKAVKAGEEFKIDFTADSDAAGFQFTMDFDSKLVDLVSIENGLTETSNFNAIDNRVAVSWNADLNTANQTMFTLVFKAKADVQTSDVISVTDAIAKAEAYTKSGDMLNIGMDFGSLNSTDEFALYQNTPNPFNGETTIGFNLPMAQNATLTVSDVSGKVLQVITADYTKGYNQVTLNSAKLSQGVLYYQLDTDNFTATRKMVVIE